MSVGDRRILVCGGAVLDCIARPTDLAQRGASRTSAPGKALVSVGGVGRNIAEGIKTLGGDVHLLSVVGDDNPGLQVVNACDALGIGGGITRLTGARTATFTALLDGAGELVGAVADMDIFERFSPQLINSAQFAGARLVVCDANLPQETLKTVLESSHTASVPAWFEPVSVAKAPRAKHHQPWHLISPNWDELLAMLGRAHEELPVESAFPRVILDAVSEALGSGLAENVLLTLGSRGVVLASRTLVRARSYHLDVAAILGEGGTRGVPQLVVHVEPLTTGAWWFRLGSVLDVKNVIGAGDAVVSGAAAAFSRGFDLQDAVVVGMLCAHCTLFVDGSVGRFTPAMLDRFQRLNAARL